MYLLLGSSMDPCCGGVCEGLQARGLESRFIESTFADRMRFFWRLDNDSSISQVTLDGGERIGHNQIDGVLIRSAGWLDPAGWQLDDLSYAQTEAQAALIGWLWSLSCPVAGLMPASIWYRPGVPVTYWQPLLARCGLRAPEAMLTNVADEARRFGDRFGVGAVYAPFSSPDRFLVNSDGDWRGIAALQACAPVCLVEPHGATSLACVVGERVVWDGMPPSGAKELGAGLSRFARSIGLNFVEFAIAEARDRACVVAVEPLPHFERFGELARQEIVQSLVEFLTRGTKQMSARTASAGKNRVGSLEGVES